MFKLFDNFELSDHSSSSTIYQVNYSTRIRRVEFLEQILLIFEYSCSPTIPIGGLQIDNIL